MESNQMFILMKNCTKIGLRLNKQMVGLMEKSLNTFILCFIFLAKLKNKYQPTNY